jgi:hypothetical protein
MSQQHLSCRILAGALTFVGLGLMWIAILGSVPSEQDLSAKEAPLSSRPASAVPVKPLSEPTLDLSIPGVPAMPPASTSAEASPAMEMPPASMPLDRRAAQVARLRCEAEVEQLCPDGPGPGRKACLEKRAHQLPPLCQQQLRERLVRWKEERTRLTAACQADIKQFCSGTRPGTGQALQCLQEHAQQLSDGCYEMLPKGMLYFKH